MLKANSTVIMGDGTLLEYALFHVTKLTHAAVLKVVRIVRTRHPVVRIIGVFMPRRVLVP